MFLKQLSFEFNYFRKQPSFYVTALVFFLLSFFAMISDNVQIGGSSNVLFNSPHAITQTLVIMSMIGMFLVANFIGGTATRDYTSKIDGIMHALPVPKTSYLWGRWTGSLLFCLSIFLLVPLGTLLGTFWPTVDAERLGDTTLVPYFWAMIIFVIPNFIFCASFFYLLAMKFRSMMGMWLGVIAFFVLYNVSQAIMDDPQFVHLAAYLDPFAYGAFFESTRYWTPFERNTQLVDFEGMLMYNRILWLGISALMILATHMLIDYRAQSSVKKAKQKADTQAKPKTFTNVRSSDQESVSALQFVRRTRFEVSQVVKSAPFIILCLIAMFNLSGLYFFGDAAWGTENWPTTRNMANYIIGSFFLMTMIVITFYSGESVWRERMSGIGDIVESTPIRNWTIYFPKLIAMLVVVAALTISGVLFTTLFQVINSYTHFEWGVYAQIMSLEFILPMIQLAMLAMFIQVLSPNKYIGMMIFVGYIILSIVATQLGLEHRLLRLGRPPAINYSDINEAGHYLIPAIWYNIYGFGIMIALTIVGYGLWRRGAEYSLKYRLRMLGSNLGRSGKVALVASVAVFVSAGSFIYYNTVILNEFSTSEERLDLQAEYERTYKQYEDLPIPTITDVYAEVNFYPSERRVDVDGYYLIENKNAEPLEKVMVTWMGGKNRTMEISGENISEADRKDNYYLTWLNFEPALQPGESRRLDFDFERKNPGFTDSNVDNNLVENGSFVNNFDLFPHFGYNTQFEISDRHERRKRELPEPERAAKLEDESQYNNSFFGPEADFINFETIISTSEDQFAIAPGYIQREWVEDGRHYYHYKMDSPMANFMAFLSGRFEKTADVHDDIAIEVYHHDAHDMNVQRMIDATKASLDYFGEEFGPYQHRQVRIIEFPGYSRFAQSFANTIPYSEDIGFIANLESEDAIDYVYFVTAHEMAHQWWAHQVVPANVQGSAVLSETLSEYSAYMVMEKMLGEHQLRQFLKYELNQYLRGRSAEVIEEMPLYRAENQSYIHYAKGGIIMYALRDMIGEEAVNKALRDLLTEFKFKADPYPTTLDLLRHIKANAPESAHDFIDDGFKLITIYDLKTKEALVTKRDDGKFDLKLTLEASKYYADGQGEETATALDMALDIGVFSKDPDKAKGKDHIVYMQKHNIVSGENTITLTLDEEPKFAGVDPYVKMIDRNADDNLQRVSSD